MGACIPGTTHHEERAPWWMLSGWMLLHAAKQSSQSAGARAKKSAAQKFGIAKRRCGRTDGRELAPCVRTYVRVGATAPHRPPARHPSILCKFRVASSPFYIVRSFLFFVRVSDRVDNGDASNSYKLANLVEKHVTDLNPGTIFGEVSMLTECKRNATARVSSAQAVVMKICKNTLCFLIGLTGIS